MKMVVARADLSEPSQRAIVLRLTKLRWLATRLGVRPALHRGTFLCRPRERGARVAVSRTYLQRHGRLLTEGGDMQAIIERCCGLDVHQETLVACLLVGVPGAQPNKEVRTFRTVTRDLEALRDWLRQAGATHVGMESTGVYWRPVYAVLEGHFELIVGNAQHMRNVAGRKTDVKDSEWIADLVRHGLIAKSFVPPRPLRDLRDLLRYRRKLVESQAAERNRLLKLLETANIKLASVASDVFGVSGRAMLRALIAGETSAEAM